MEYSCKKCGYEWNSRKDMPRACPNCKSYQWDKDYTSPSYKSEDK